jgi:hypothetical protein
MMMKPDELPLRAIFDYPDPAGLNSFHGVPARTLGPKQVFQSARSRSGLETPAADFDTFAAAQITWFPHGSK